MLTNDNMQKTTHRKTAKIMNGDITWATRWQWHLSCCVVTYCLHVAANTCINCSFLYVCGTVIMTWLLPVSTSRNELPACVVTRVCCKNAVTAILVWRSFAFSISVQCRSVLILSVTVLSCSAFSPPQIARPLHALTFLFRSVSDFHSTTISLPRLRRNCVGRFFR